MRSQGLCPLCKTLFEVGNLEGGIFPKLELRPDWPCLHYYSACPTFLFKPQVVFKYEKTEKNKKVGVTSSNSPWPSRCNPLLLFPLPFLGLFSSILQPWSSLLSSRKQPQSVSGSFSGQAPGDRKTRGGTWAARLYLVPEIHLGR